MKHFLVLFPLGLLFTWLSFANMAIHESFDAFLTAGLAALSYTLALLSLTK